MIFSNTSRTIELDEETKRILGAKRNNLVEDVHEEKIKLLLTWTWNLKM
jgi:hypothetical protein